VGGLGSAIYHPAAAAMARTTGAAKGISMSLFAAGGAVGSAIMPVAVLAIVRSFGTQYVPLLSIVGVAVGVVLFLLTPEQERAIVPAGTRSKFLDTSLLKGPVGLLAASGILRAMAFITFTNGMPLCLSVTRGCAPVSQVIGLTLSLNSTSSATGSVRAGFVEPRFGRIVLVSGSMLMALPCLAAVLLVDAGGAVFYLC